MKRRRFLGSAGALAGLAAAPLARAAVAAAEPPRFLLLVAPDASAGTPFVPVGEAPCADCVPPLLAVSIEGPASEGSLAGFERLELRAMFASAGGAAVPFVAWRHAAGPVPGQAACARFVAGREALRHLEIAYRLSGEGSRRMESCRIARPGTAWLSPGHYVLAFPRTAGSPTDASGLVHSGDERSPLAGPAARHFDALAIRVEPAG